MSYEKLERSFDLLQYLRQHDPLGRISSGNMSLLCPDCQKRKLYVLLEKRHAGSATINPGAWKCFRCGDGGVRLVSLIEKLERVERSAAIEYLRTNSNPARLNLEALLTEAFDENKTDSTADSMPHIRLPDEFQPYSTKKKMAAFTDRGITPRQARRFGIGFCRSGKYRNRIVVPVFAPNGGHLVSFVARHFDRKPPENVRKVLYHKKETTVAVLSRCLFNYDRAKYYKRIVLVEDVFSPLKIGDCAVATFGTSLSETQFDLLLETAAEEIILMWDRDAMVPYVKCGLSPSSVSALVRDGSLPCKPKCPHCKRYANTQKTLTRLAEFWRVRQAILPDKRDPKDHTRERNWQIIDMATEYTGNSLKQALKTCF